MGLIIRGSLVQFPAGALWSVLGQDSLFHIASVYPAAKWVPSINKAVLRACALYAASCSGLSPRGIEMVSVCTVPARGGRSCERFGGYKTINRIPLLYTISQSLRSTLHTLRQWNYLKKGIKQTFTYCFPVYNRRIAVWQCFLSHLEGVLLPLVEQVEQVVMYHTLEPLKWFIKEWQSTHRWDIKGKARSLGTLPYIRLAFICPLGVTQR